MNFRRLTLEDLDLFDKFFQDNPLDEDLEDIQDRTEDIESEIRTNKFQYFGYIDRKSLVAYGKLRFDGKEAHFIGPFVLPEYRRKGIGGNLINNIENYCRELGTSRLNAYSFIDTKLAEDFLTSIGYQLESVGALGVNVYIKKF